MLERSLKDLRTEYIDLYMIHWPDRNIDIRKPMECLSRAKDDGKIRAIGLCNTSDDEIKKAAEIDRIDALQAECNLFNPLPFESLRATLKEQKMGFMGWGTLDKGILTGRVTPGRTFETVDARSWAPWWKHEDRTPKYKAMELIDLYEGKRRGFYGGAIGFLRFNGDINHAIMIRSFLSCDHTLFYQAGAGIVSESTEEGELEEVNNKLAALKSAIALARNMNRTN